MWFVLALITTLCWGIADLFYKKGSNSNERYSALRIVVAVGAVMGIHAVLYMLINDVEFEMFDMVRYLPVSALYILSMALGYVGLRYIELSISSPVQNSSGAITAILCLIFLKQFPDALETVGIVLITVGLIAMAIYEKKSELGVIDEANKKYVSSFRAIIFPVLYCIIDGLGTFADAVYLNEDAPLISENGALLSYEFTFFVVGVIVFLYLTLVKKEKFSIPEEKDRLLAAIFETAGQVSYVFVIGGKAVIAAPMIASYCIVSVILSAIFLKEKLLKKQYLIIALVVLGIIILGISDGLGGEI